MVKPQIALSRIFALALATAPAAAEGQSLLDHFQRPAGFARDDRLNRVIQPGARRYTGNATATANIVSVTQEGSGNTVVLNVSQNNSGAITASTALNGRLRLD